MINDKILTSTIGLAGVGSIEAVQVAQQVNPAVISDGLGIISQIVILVVTLIGLFKKKKVTNNQN